MFGFFCEGGGATASFDKWPPAPLLGTSDGTDQSEVLIDLVGLDVQSNSPPQTSSASALLWGPADPLAPFPKASAAGVSLLDHDLFSLGKNKKTKKKNPVEIKKTVFLSLLCALGVKSDASL